MTGVLTGKRVNLSSSVSLSSGAGIFSGYGRIVLCGSSRFYHIALPSGQVTDLGPRPGFTYRRYNGWAFWGVAEYFGGAISVVYVQDSTTIARLRVGAAAGVATVAESFSNLGSMGALTVSTLNSRWYFHHANNSQFASGSHVLGSAKAVFVTDPGYPVIYVNPVARTNNPNDTVVFETVAGGQGQLAYQWRVNGTNIAGAKQRFLVLTNVQPEATGNYSVSVANAAGSASSLSARLLVVSAPVILTQPVTHAVSPGTNTTFSVGVQAAPPVSYQWRFNGTALAGATNSTLVLAGVTAEQAGYYSVTVSNRYGGASSIEAQLIMMVDTGFSFQVRSLGADAVTVDHAAVTGSSRSSLAVSSNQVLYVGSSGVGRFFASDLSSGASLGAYYLDSLVSDLKTEKVYSLANGTNLVGYVNSATTVSNLVEIDCLVGRASTNVTKLSSPITVNNASGLFAGYGQVVIYNGSRVYRIALPSGVVADMGTMASFTRQLYAGWSFYGLAENFGGAVYLVYVQNNTSIVRTRVPDGQTSTIANFVNLNATSAIGASVPRGRWYFHNAGVSQFASGAENLGYCSAEFSVVANQAVDHFTVDPVVSSPSAGVPFAVTITARTVLNDLVTNYDGAVALSGVAAGGGSVTVSPGVVSGFVNGVWSGEVTVWQPDVTLALRVQDDGGHIGLGGYFGVGAVNDLKVTFSSEPAVGSVGGQAQLAVVVTNTGPLVSTGVWLTNDLAAGLGLLSVAPSQGAVVSTNDGRVVVDLGTIPGGAAATVVLTVQTPALGVFTNRAQAARQEVEVFTANNEAVCVAPVTPPQVVVGDVSVVKPRSSSVFALFPVSLSVTSATQIKVFWTTTNGTATTASGDYASRYGTLTFNPGTLCLTCSVPVTGNTLYQPDRYFSVLATNITGAIAVKPQGRCTIIDTNAAPDIVIFDASTPEGNTGTGQLQFSVQLSKKPGAGLSVRYTTVDGSARAGVDYQAVAGVLNFGSGVTNMVVTVPVVRNTQPELDKTLSVQLSDPQGASLVRTQALGTIVNDDGVGVVDHFTWTGLGATQVLNQPFPATVTAYDYFNTVISSFNAGVTFTCFSGGGQETSTIGGGGTTFYFPFLTYYQDSRSTVLYTAAELKGGRRIGALALNVTTPPSGTLTRWTIRMKHTAQSTVASTFDNTGWTTVYQRNESIPATGWATFTFTTPFDYNGTDNLLIDFSYYNTASGSGFGYVTATNIGVSSRGLYGYCTGCGDPLLFDSGVSPSHLTSTVIPVVRLTSVSGDMPMSPVVSGNFTNGVWAGNLRVQVAGEGLRLGAADTSQHRGYSSPLTILPYEDLAVSVLPSGNPAPAGQDLVYSVVVSNSGPSASSSVTMVNQCPPGVPLISAVLDRGVLSGANGLFSAGIGTLAAGETATLTVVVRPAAGVWLTNVASVSRTEAELYLGNNWVTNVVYAAALGMSVSNVTVTERRPGEITNAVFQVWLSASPRETVRVDYSTRSIGATAGLDFQAASGTLVFAPGVTNLSVSAPVYGDDLSEGNETFALDLTNAVNAPLIRATATATIINDDPLPMISAADVSVQEGDSGLVPVTFTLGLSGLSGPSVQVRCFTSDGTAYAGRDYITTNAVVVFPAGATTMPFTVLVRANTIPERDKVFWLNLTNVYNATLATVQARGILLNDDGAPALFDRYVWTPVDSPQLYGRPFAASVAAVDGEGVVVTNYSGAASLRAFQPAGMISDSIFPDFAPGDAYQGDFTIGIGFIPSVDLTVTHLRSVTGRKVSLWTAEGTLLASVENPNPQGAWAELPLAAPVRLSANTGYRVGYYTGGSSNNYYLGADARTEFDHGILDTGYYNVGDTFPSQAAGAVAWGVDIRYLGPGPSAPVDASPGSILFSNGVWSGWVTVLEPVTNLYLAVDDGQGHYTATPEFDLLSADLAFTQSWIEAPASVYQPVVCRLVVTNQGPCDAAAVEVQVLLPAVDMTLSAALASQGQCVVSNNTVRCFLGELALGASAEVELTLLAGRGGSYTNQAMVASGLGDPVPDNNTAVWVTRAGNDDDHDGLPDDWELSHDYDPGNPADALSDLDHDGVNALNEFRAGTSSSDPASYPRLSVRLESSYVMMLFTSAADRIYQVEWSATPSGGVWAPVGDAIRGDGDVKAVLDFPSEGGAARFYRLRITF